jgi:hypothetical protein
MHTSTVQWLTDVTPTGLSWGGLQGPLGVLGQGVHQGLVGLPSLRFIFQNLIK